MFAEDYADMEHRTQKRVRRQEKEKLLNEEGATQTQQEGAGFKGNRKGGEGIQHKDKGTDILKQVPAQNSSNVPQQVELRGEANLECEQSETLQDVVELSHIPSVTMNQVADSGPVEMASSSIEKG